MKYAVWIHVEETDGPTGYFRDIVAPICVGVLGSRAEAETLAGKIAGSVPTEPSNRLLLACKHAEQTFRKFGETTGFGLAGPECWAVIEELREAAADAEER